MIDIVTDRLTDRRTVDSIVTIRSMIRRKKIQTNICSDGNK